jgi:hypothetical protein
VIVTKRAVREMIAAERRSRELSQDMSRNRHWELSRRLDAVLAHLGLEVVIEPPKLVAKPLPKTPAKAGK